MEKKQGKTSMLYIGATNIVVILREDVCADVYARTTNLPSAKLTRRTPEH